MSDQTGYIIALTWLVLTWAWAYTDRHYRRRTPPLGLDRDDWNWVVVNLDMVSITGWVIISIVTPTPWWLRALFGVSFVVYLLLWDHTRRNRKKKLIPRLLARVYDLGHRLTVVPEPA